LSTKCIFVIVCGAWHGPASFEPTGKLLCVKGYGVIGNEHLSSAAKPTQGFEPDIEALKKTIEGGLSTGKDVVLVMHSYGGMVGTEFTKYFIDANEGKVVRMVWICATVCQRVSL
jgi:pimeloyl-ACP methyl ester carboxylesterase